MEKNQAVTTYEDFYLPAEIEAGAFSKDDLAEDYDGVVMRFPRVKVPSGGGVAWEIPNPLDPEKPGISQSLEGVLLFQHSSNAYWQETGSTSEPPDCAAIDGKMGRGIPGGPCADCPLNEFGTGKDAKGKACKNTRRLYLLQSGAKLPLEVILPPTSLRSFDDFLTSVFVSRGRGIAGSLVSLGLKKQENASGQQYSTVTFRLIKDFDGEQVRELVAFARAFRDSLKANWQKASEDDIRQSVAE